MSERVAVLLDGGFVQKRLYSLLGRKMPTAKDILSFAGKCVASDEELFRIYYYDCPPFGGTLVHPMSGASEDYSATAVFAARTKLLDVLTHSDHVAFRGGVLATDGWKLKFKAQQDLMKTSRAWT
jgi:hypothetical protein